MSAPERPRQPNPPAAKAAEEGQLGFLFEDRAAPRPAPAAPRSSPPAPAAAGGEQPTRRTRAAASGSRPDTLPAWARAAMPAAAPAQAASAEEEPTRRVWRVADLVSEVRVHIEQAYADLWVRGEISNLRAAPSGHMYFTLKDGEAQLPAVLFRRQAQLLRFRPEDGLEVLLRGRVSVYEQRGQMQLIAEYLEPVGAGSLQIAFEQLKRRLEEEGLFAMDRKRALPLYPHCIGIVTSPTGAVIRDFLNVAGRRHASLDVLLYPAAVQGDQAAAEIAAGIAWFNRAGNVDVIVIARGGGSLEDLAPFNSELVARAIARSHLPVVSAVGHETDFTIADFVADLRAATPSAAAELITTALHQIAERIDALCAGMLRAARYGVALARQRMAQASIATSYARLRDGLGRREQRVDEQRFRLERAERAAMRTAAERWQSASAALLRQDATQRLHLMSERAQGLELRLRRVWLQLLQMVQARHRQSLDRLARYDALAPIREARGQQDLLGGRLVRGIATRLAAAAQQQAGPAQTLASLSPLAVLGRGYAVAFAADGTVMHRADQAQPGAAIRVRLAAGTLDATVTATTQYRGKEPRDER